MVLIISAAISVELPFNLANDPTNPTASVFDIPILAAINPTFACVLNVAADTSPNSDANAFTVPAVSSNTNPSKPADAVVLFKISKPLPSSLLTSANLLTNAPAPITNAPIAA